LYTRNPDLAQPSIRNRLLSGGAWAFGGKFLAAFTGLASNVLLARLLSPQDLGVYFLAFSIVSFGAVLGSQGLNKAVVRLVAENVGLGRFGQARRAITLVVVLGAFGALGVGLAYLPLGHVVGKDLFHSPALVAITGLVAGWMIVETLQQILIEIFRGFHDIRSATVFGGLVTSGGLLTVVVFIASLVLLWWNRDQVSLTTIMFLTTMSGGISAALAGLLLRRRVSALPSEGADNRMRVKDVLYVSGPLLVTNLTLFVLLQADLWILGMFRSQGEVAVYGAANRVVAPVTMPLLVINLVVPPLIAEMHAQGRMNELQRTMRAAATLAGIPAFLVLGVFVVAGAPILGWLFGDYYRAGATVLALLSAGKLVSVWAGSCGLMLQMTGHQATMMWITIFTGLLMILGAVVVVGNYGATGVAAAAAASLALQNVLMLMFSKKRVGVWTHPTLSRSSIRRFFAGSE
jgi:O-antigen/teichoic acid export membrane protein